MKKNRQPSSDNRAGARARVEVFPIASLLQFARSVGMPVAMLLIMAVGIGCDVPRVDVIKPDPWAISLQPKGSCLPKGNVPYSASCLALLSFELVPLDGGDIIRRCYRFSPEERPASIFSVLQRGQFFSTFLTKKGDYIVRVRGLHNESSTLPSFAEANDGGIEDDCAGLDLVIGDSRRWLVWGESKPVTYDQTASDGGGTIEIPVRIECRNCEGGCDAIGNAVCPEEFPPSYCAPSDTANTCARVCGPEQSCFDGEVICAIPDGGVDGRCDSSISGGTKFCATCVTGAECPADYACVGTQNRRFCSRPCPAEICPSGAVCKRVGGEILTF